MRGYEKFVFWQKNIAHPFKEHLGDLASGLGIMEVGWKRRGFFTCTKNRWGEQVTYVFNKNYLVLLRFKLGPKWAGTISGDRLVFRVILLYCTRLRNTRHLKGRFNECTNKNLFFLFEKRTALDVGGSQMNWNKTEFLYLIVRSIYLEEADSHWELRLIFTICFYYIVSYMIYTKYIIIYVIIYSLVCVPNFIMFAGRLFFWHYLLHKSIN